MKEVTLNKRQRMDGLSFLKSIGEKFTPLVFFDPQYRSVLQRLSYGNEKSGKAKKRASLPQMNDKDIKDFIHEVNRILVPSGHMMMWVDKYLLCNDVAQFVEGTDMQLVDMITWDKQRMGMGYRSRRVSEYLVIFQKTPIRAKDIWQSHDIPDVWAEKVVGKNHTHAKPIELQERLIRAVTNYGDIVVDPCAGGYSVLFSAIKAGRNFLGCDILG